MVPVQHQSLSFCFIGEIGIFRLSVLKLFNFSLLILLPDHMEVSKNELLLQHVELEGPV